MAIHPSQILFYAGGRSLELFGTPSRRVAPIARRGEDIIETFTRASTGTYIDANGEVKLAEIDALRIDMVDLDGDGIRETPAFLLEDTRTNGFTRSEELNDAAWTKTRATVSANTLTAPDGLVTADKLVEDATPSDTHHFERNTPALTDNTDQSFSLFARADERDEIRILLAQKDGTNADVWLDLSAGTVGTESGGATGIIEARGTEAIPWYRCTLIADSASGGTTPKIVVQLGSGSETEVYNGDGSSGLFIWGMQFGVDKAFPSSYIATAGSTVTRAQEQLSYPFNAQPQAMTIYARFIEQGTIKASALRLLEISNATPRLFLRESSGNYQVLHENDTANVAATLAAAPSIGDTVELVALVSANGSVKLIQSINAAASTETATTAALTFATAWNTKTLWVNSVSTSFVGYAAFADLALFAGVHSLADCRAATQQ